MSGFSFRPAHRWLSVSNPPTVFCPQRICPSVFRRAAAVHLMRRQGAQKPRQPADRPGAHRAVCTEHRNPEKHHHPSQFHHLDSFLSSFHVSFLPSTFPLLSVLIAFILPLSTHPDTGLHAQSSTVEGGGVS